MYEEDLTLNNLQELHTIEPNQNKQEQILLANNSY